VEYCRGGEKPLLMDVFLPKARVRRPTPAVLWLHGGGWERGDKNGSSGARFLAAAGFVTASIYYRLSGEAKFPADIEDCKCAIRYLRANAAKYGIEPERIGVAGASSGGHLALLVGLADENAGLEGSGGWPNVSSGVSAVSSYYGPTDLRTMATDFGGKAQAAITKLIGAAPEENPTAYRTASPIVYVATGKPPILMIHGKADGLVPLEQSKRVLEACLRVGVKAKLVEVENADHDFETHDRGKPLGISIEEIHQITIEFFEKELLNRE
jgi:acetyl esterase/lipase